MSDAPRFPYVLVDVAPEDADVTSAELFELGAQGVEEHDQETFVKAKDVARVTLAASFATRAEADDALAALAGSLSPRLFEVVGDAWRDEWKKHFRPFDLCQGIVVRPPWEPHVETREGWQVLELEPGRAFGTGLHDSTSLVARAIEAHVEDVRGAPILDVGCGSGILALVALKLGATHARGVDVDVDSVRIARENAERNGLTDRTAFDTTDVAQLTGTWPVVLANIEAFVLIPMAPALALRLAPGGLLILSGILNAQSDSVRAAYSQLARVEAPSRGEWTALVLRAPR